jgi:hypothetical protein
MPPAEVSINPVLTDADQAKIEKAVQLYGPETSDRKYNLMFTVLAEKRLTRSVSVSIDT